MSASFYHLVRYLHDPGVGASRLVGALVVVDGGVRVVVHLGERDRGSVFLRRVLDELPRVAEREGMPRTFGPRIVIEGPTPIPDDVEDPARWVDEHVLARAAA